MPNIFNTANKFGLVYTNAVGPWPCEQCKQITQYAEIKGDKNHIFCKNEYCKFERMVDVKKQRIVEADGTMWAYNTRTGEKVRIRNQ